MRTKILDSEVEIFYKCIGKNVRKFREEKGMSQMALSQAIGHSSTTIVSNGEIANGKHFNLEHIYKIAKVFEIDICELLK